MSDPSLQRLTSEKALDILGQYVRRNLGGQAVVSGVTFRDDFQVWECWVSGVDGYVKAYIVRLGPANGEWVCRHITVMEPPVIQRPLDR